MTSDICIIGAGPAGLTASLTLAKHNIPHLLVDSGTFPRNKACADIITAGVNRVLNEIDPAIMLDLKARQAINPIWKTIVYPPGGKEINIDFLPFDNQPLEPSCYAISRHEFDNVLLGYAAKNVTTTIVQDCHISSVEHFPDHIKLSAKKGETITARLIIVATGSSNSLLKYIQNKFPDRYCSIGIRAYYQNVKCAGDCTELILERALLPGGMYITPLPNNEFNVNIVVFLENASRNKMDLRKTFESMIESNPVLKEKFAEAKRIGNFEGSKLFMGVKSRSLCGERFLIAGDSAGLIDIVSGNGIPQAMVSGKYAALNAIKALKSGKFTKEFMSDYEREVNKKVKSSLVMGRVLYPFIRFELFCRIGLKLLKYLSLRPTTNILLRDLLYDKNPKTKLLNPLFYYRLFLK